MNNHWLVIVIVKDTLKLCFSIWKGQGLMVELILSWNDEIVVGWIEMFFLYVIQISCWSLVQNMLVLMHVEIVEIKW